MDLYILSSQTDCKQYGFGEIGSINSQSLRRCCHYFPLIKSGFLFAIYFKNDIVFEEWSDRNCYDLREDNDALLRLYRSGAPLTLCLVLNHCAQLGGISLSLANMKVLEIA